MDVRLSPEQVALRDSAAQVVDRLGIHLVADLEDTERMGKLDAAVTASGWRELRTESDEGGPWASAVEVAVVAEELGRGLADVPFLGPTLAADLRRLAGATYEEIARAGGGILSTMRAVRAEVAAVRGLTPPDVFFRPRGKTQAG